MSEAKTNNKNKRPKFTDQQIKEMREMINNNFDEKYIIEYFKTTWVIFNNIRIGKTYKNVK